MFIRRHVSSAVVPLALGSALVAVCFARTGAQAPDARVIYLPLVINNSRPLEVGISLPAPARPVARVTDILDGDNSFNVVWTTTPGTARYTLQEATVPTFADAKVVVASSPANSFARRGARPGQYYYRLQAANQWSQSLWSATVVADVSSLFIAMIMRWDEVDEISAQGNTAVAGVHQERMVTGNLTLSIAQVSNRVSFDPNPFEWQTEEWFTTYDNTSLTLVGRSNATSPFAKWGAPWIMPRAVALRGGAQVQVAGKTFDVSGPDAYRVLNYIPIAVWKLTNREEIVTFEDDKGVQIKALPNDEVLWYAADASRLLVKYAERLGYYQNGTPVDLAETHAGLLAVSNSFDPLPGR